MTPISTVKAELRIVFLYFDESTTSAAAQQQLNKQMRSSFQTKAIFYQQANLSTELF